MIAIVGQEQPKTRNEVEFERIRWENITLLDFVREFWPVIERGKMFVEGRHIDAICQHLEAVSQGKILRLLVNMPPRHAKSTIISVFWPVWSWIKNPSLRWLCASYALNLAIRDNVKCRRLILSPEFQERYGHIFQLTKDQNAKVKFETNFLGYRMAVSVGSSATGEGGDILLCLCYNAEVTTDRGRLCIGDIVEKRLPVRVLAFDHKADIERWQRIEKYEKNPGRSCVRVTFSDGRTVDATVDHPFYVVGRGYVRADQLIDRDEVVTDESYLRELRERVQSQASRDSLLQTSLLRHGMPQHVNKSYLRNMWKRNRSYSQFTSASKAHILQQGMSGQRAKSRSERQDSMCCVWKGSGTASWARCTQYKRNFLQSRMSWEMANRAEQSCVSGWYGRTHLQELQQIILCQDQQKINRFLLQLLQRAISQRFSVTALSRVIRQLCVLWRADENYKAKSREAEYVFSQVCQSGAQRIYQGRAQWTVCGWNGFVETLSKRVLRAISSSQRARQAPMSLMWYGKRTKWQGIRCASCRLQQRSQQNAESNSIMSFLPRQDARLTRTKKPVDAVLVTSVEPIETPQYVYNICVTEDHNYYANGILVHNCDDPHAIDEKESDTIRESALDWFNNTWSSRLNDQQTGAMVVVGQRIHSRDVSGHILETNNGEWTHLNLPTLFEASNPCTTYLSDGSVFWQDWRTQEGELLWPTRFPLYVIERARMRHGSIGFAALYQQRPVPASGGQFKKQWFRYYTQEDTHYCLESPETVKRVLKEQCHRIITVDLAISQKQSADYTVIAVWAITPDRELLLLDRLRDHLDNPEQQKQIQLFYQRYHPRYIQVENVAYQLAIIQQLLRLGLPTKEYKPVKDKVSRASTAAVLYEAGRVYHPRQASWLPEWEDELLTFPMGAHDDQVDTCSMACDALSGPSLSDLKRELDERQSARATTQERIVKQRQDWYW